jgi:hypothetical protein
MALTRLNTNAYGSTINLTSNVTGTLPAGNGGTGATSFAPGKILQVVQGASASSTTTTSSSFVATATEVDITPSATSSKIFVLVTSGLFWSNDTDAGSGGGATIYRDSTNISPADNYMIRTHSVDDTNIQLGGASMSILDSPSSTSAITYKVYIKSIWSSASMVWNSGSDYAIITAWELAV